MRWILCAATLSLLASAVQAETLQPKTMTVSGYASTEAKPDIATINIGVDTADKRTVKAVSANAELMAKVVDAIKQLGIPASAMQTTDFTIKAQHPMLRDGYNEDTTVTLGYSVSNTLTITIEDIGKVASVIDTAVKAGANSSNSVVFDVKNRQALDDKVLAEAIKDARHNAEVMAAAENVHVGKLQSASNYAAPFDFVAGYAAPMMASRRLADTIIMPGQVRISASVSAVFALE